MTVELRFGSGTETYSDTEIVSMSPILTHTGMGDFRITIKGDRALEEYAARQERTHIAFDNSVEWTGYITDCSHSKSGGTTTIQGEGIAKRLKETRPDYESLGGALTYQNISVEDAIDDYWGRTEFSNYTVYDQNTETIATDELIQGADTQSEWENILDPIPETLPITVTTTGLELGQICWTTEGEDFTTAQTGFDDGSTDTEISNNDYITVSRGPGVTSGPDFATWDFTPDHTIPGENFQVRIRQASNANGAPALTWTLEHANGNSYQLDTAPNTGVGLSDDFTWVKLPFFTSTGRDDDIADVTKDETHTLRVEVDDSGGNADTFQYYIDVVAPYDDRYEANLTFDETTTNNYLDGPELYPTVGVSHTTQAFLTSFNVTASNVDTTIDDTTGNQAIEVSNDGGDTYTQFNNTTTVDHTYTTNGREAKVRFTLDRYGTRDTATPRTGFNSQTIDTYEHRVDGNDLAVVVDLELSKNHFDNLQTLHEKGEFLWAITHSDLSIENILVESFKRGEQTKTLPFEKEIDSTPRIAAKNYYNSIYLQGRLVNGERPTAEVTDSDRIAEDGREISPGVLRNLDISTEAGASYLASTLLERATTNNALRGQKVYPARFDIVPGFAYSVSFQDDGSTEEFTLEEISLRLGTNQAETTLDFVPPQDLSEDISALRRNSRQQSDQL